MKKRTLLIFALIPTILATVSAFHLESMVRLGNHIWLSIPVAVAYELANLIIILLIVNSKNVNKFYVFIAFIIIIFMQILGNVYASYTYILENNPENTFFDILNFFPIDVDRKMSNFILSNIIGTFLPIISLLLTKVVSDIIDKENAIAEKIPEVVKEIIEEKIEEPILEASSEKNLEIDKKESFDLSKNNVIIEE